ncbi:PBECR4 domain-containing protein [Streptococcus oralis]|uniref:PBECR4 domain-containing protein n=1 Tax=Streptococcus oralis TaxID=1303 RepID=UPI001D06DC03|nr:PBECR4 domain-containing protein [Streptococcus oralis]MCB7107774.1 PBECR4 domain-containing protein [Streptococcus oralis]MCQ5168964.1 PBECR4 domain-containing protein [Streptococcus oralis]
MVLTKAQAKSLDILEVARSLGMEMKRKSHREYYWAEHDSFKIDTVKNTWHWYSQNLFGDTINLVQQMQNVSYKDAMVFLETGSFPEAKPVEEERKPFNYTLAPYEQPFVEARAYLKEIRGLSDDTIDFFLEKGVLAQAKRKDKEGIIEDVLVFKYLDRNHQLVGASLQGLVPDQERHPGKGYLKQIMYQSEAISGLNVSIGSPKSLIVTEAPIDLMSYYELHKGELNDVRLVAMEGLKEGVLSHYFLEILQERGDIPMDERDYTKSSELARTSRFLSVAAETSTLFQDHKYDDLITLAVDRDKAGTDFITKLREKKIPVVDARPPKREGQEKTDWNEILKQEKQLEQTEEIQASSHFPDTSHLSPEDAEWLKENWNNISFSVQSTRPSETDLAAEEKHSPGNQESIGNIEENAGRTMSYEEVKRENEALTKELNNRIQSGELSIEFAPDFYLYDVFAKLGNSHPTKYLNDKRMEVLSPIHSLLSSIDDRTVDLYKEKGTPEQDSLYQALKPHQRTLGVDISTRFIGELAIAAYNTNKQIESLSSDSFGVYFDERTLDNLSQSVERMLEYPLIESGKRDFTYGFVTTPNTLYHYLEEQEGEVVLNRELLDNLISRLETHPIKIMEASEEKEKAPEKTQELDMIFEQQKNERTSGSLGSLQPEAEGSPTPVPKAGTFERSVTSRPTTSSHLLYFTINEEFQSSNDGYYHSISLDELTKLNRPIRRLALQNAAQYYLDELANSKIYYVTPDKTVQVHFEEKHFMHLTGIKPIALGQTPEKTLHDFAEGNGHFDNILLANNDAAFDKLKVLSDLSVATESTSFYFDDLTDLRRYDGRFDSLIKSDDKDIILLFKELEEENYIPISVFKSRTKLTKELETVDKTPILGVFRERDGQIEQLSINEEYVKDGGEEMLSILKNKQYEEVPKEIEQTTLENTLNSPLLDSATFTQVLDTVYNLGVPGDISKTPEEFHQAWNQYLDYAKQHNDKFDQIVAAAGADHLLDTNSDFYKEWQQDHIYKENYHVRLQWAEERPDGPKLPFKETELISYQEFARELYKANQSFYSLHQEGIKQVTDGRPEGYISPTKVQFSIYAPDGELIQDSIRYNIGEEINPIAHKERLGTREMREHPELMKIDGAIFTQYHLERLASELDISQFSYALEDTPYADQLLSQVPFGVLENSPIGFSDSSHDSRLGFISFDGMDSVEVENLSAWFEKLGVKDSPMEQVALVEKWQKEIKDLSEKVEQTIENIRDEFEKTQEEEIKLEEQGHNKQELKRDADADGVSDDEELLQGTNPYDFRSKPGSKPDVEEGLQAEEVVLAAGSLAVADLTQNTDIGLYIRFNWSENKAIRDRFEEDELVPYEEFIEILYFENERLRPEGNGYYKTSFDIENEKGESYTFGIRYDIGSELYPLSEMMDERFSEEYIEYASKLDKKAIEKVQSELDETKNNRKEIIDADEELQAEEVVLATSSLAVADFIQNKDMAGLSRHLKEGIKEFLDSDKYKDYLTKMSQLNNYSNRNLRLILAQNPEARQVASFKQWKENFGRHVKKGEKALRIFKPMTKIKKDENNQPILDKNGKPETVTFFGLVPVFDVSQTEGKEMPKAAEVKEQLTDLDYANLYRALMTIAKENDVSVRFEEMENNKHGYYSVPENQIVLRSNEMNKAQIIKTFLHEMAHAELHHADNPQKENLTRSTAELQAESVAYVVSSYYGIDTSEYSFNYLSGWSADKETLADLEAQLDIVQQEAKSLMVRMDQALEQLRLSQEKQTKRSFEQKLEKFKDQSKQAVEDHKQELKADAQSKKEKGFSK